jgi:hypothetical protein
MVASHQVIVALKRSIELAKLTGSATISNRLYATALLQRDSTASDVLRGLQIDPDEALSVIVRSNEHNLYEVASQWKLVGREGFLYDRCLSPSVLQDLTSVKHQPHGTTPLPSAQMKSAIALSKNIARSEGLEKINTRHAFLAILELELDADLASDIDNLGVSLAEFRLASASYSGQDED